MKLFLLPSLSTLMIVVFSLSTLLSILFAIMEIRIFMSDASTIFNLVFGFVPLIGCIGAFVAIREMAK